MFVSLPFLVIALEVRPEPRAPTTTRWLPRWGQAGRGLLAGDAATARTRPALRGGAGVRRALGEFGATLTFAGSREGVTRTLPLEIYLQREADPEAAVALSILLIAVAVVVVVGLGSPAPERVEFRGGAGG